MPGGDSKNRLISSRISRGTFPSAVPRLMTPRLVSQDGVPEAALCWPWGCSCPRLCMTALPERGPSPKQVA